MIFIFFCLFGLLFLLMKETKTRGFVQVTVTATNGVQHSTMIPAGRQTLWEVTNAVNYARSLAAAA
jgi:hypothetical protein